MEPSSGYRPNSMPSRFGCLTFDGKGANGLTGSADGSSSTAPGLRSSCAAVAQHSGGSSAAYRHRKSAGAALAAACSDSPSTSMSLIKSGSRSSRSAVSGVNGGPPTLLPLHIRFNISELARNTSARLTSPSSSPSSSSPFAPAAFNSGPQTQSTTTSTTNCPATMPPNTSSTRSSSSIRSMVLSQCLVVISPCPLHSSPSRSADRSLQQSDAGSSQSSVDVDEDEHDGDAVRFSRVLDSETSQRHGFLLLFFVQKRSRG